MTAGDWSMLLQNPHQITCQADEVIVKSGDLLQRLYYVSRGRIRVCDEREHQVATIGERELFGESGFLEAFTGTTYVAETTAELIVIERQWLLELLMKNADVAARFYQTLFVTIGARLQELCRVGIDSTQVSPLLTDEWSNNRQSDVTDDSSSSTQSTPKSPSSAAATDTTTTPTSPNIKKLRHSKQI
jgi:hypothetical protein